MSEKASHLKITTTLSASDSGTIGGQRSEKQDALEPINPEKPRIRRFPMIFSLSKTVWLLTTGALMVVLHAAPVAVLAGADTPYLQGIKLQKQGRTEEAIRAYQNAISLDPRSGRAHYELGWSYWVLGNWAKVVKHWQQAKELGAMPAGSEQYFVEAQRNLDGKLEPLVHPPIDAEASGYSDRTGEISMRLVARFQHYNPRPQHPSDRFDRYIFSPKSARFLKDGSKVYVNALEGLATVIYDPSRMQRTNVIVHRFGRKHRQLFPDSANEGWLPFPANAPANPDIFDGKPVESALSVDGKFLFIPYYRRSYDPYSVMPSAMAIVDTQTDRILRVMATGPIPKYVVASPDGKWLAVIHWGDNTVGFIDTSSGKPGQYRHDKLVTVGKRIDLTSVEKKDRDHGCGYCLRGAVFTTDGRYLLVARMGGGGIAVIDTQKMRYIGTVKGMRQTPRHLVLSSNGETLYLSSSFAGYVSAYRTRDLIGAALRRQPTLRPLREAYTGAATRTIDISPDDRLIFAAVNKESKIVVLEAETLEKLLELPADSYPVGMAVSPDGSQLWLTSQGRKRRGGNSVSVYEISAGNRQ
jgi:DNA-binding beta-propeller fold protein YncE